MQLLQWPFFRALILGCTSRFFCDSFVLKNDVVNHSRMDPLSRFSGLLLSKAITADSSPLLSSHKLVLAQSERSSRLYSSVHLRWSYEHSSAFCSCLPLPGSRSMLRSCSSRSLIILVQISLPASKSHCVFALAVLTALTKKLPSLSTLSRLDWLLVI